MNLFNALIKSGHFYGQTNADVEVRIQTRFVITNVFSQTFHICLGEEQVSLAQALPGFGRGYIPGNQPLGKKGKNILNKWIQWTALMYKILWNGQLFWSRIPGRNTIFLKVFLQKAEHYCFTGLCLRRAIKKNPASCTEDEIWRAGNAYQSKIYALHNRQDVPLMRKCKYTAKGKPKQSWRQRCREMQLLSTKFVSAAEREGQGIILKNH